MNEETKELLRAAQDVMALVDKGLLVRNAKNDDDSDWAIKALPIVQGLCAMRDAIAKLQIIFNHGWGEGIMGVAPEVDESAPTHSLETHVKALEEALREANEVCRSAYQIAVRDGRETNWDAWIARLEKSLRLQHAALSFDE